MTDGAGVASIDDALAGWMVHAVTDAGPNRQPRAVLTDLPDASLVAECRSGSPDAFGVIVERHQRAVYQLCYRFVGSHEDAADLTQDVFLRAYRGLARFRGDASLATWLYRIGVNVCLNKVSARGPALVALDDNPAIPSKGPDPSSALLQDERARRVRDAVARLPRTQRATLILRVYQDLSHKEIAELLDTTVGAVKANCFHALGNLKRLLSNGPKESLR